MARVIRKYANRRLYDTEQKKTITLNDVAALVKSGIEVQIVDNKTGEDITAHTFSQILAGQTKGWQQEAISLELLKRLIQKGGAEMLEAVKKAMLAGIGALDLSREKGEKFVDELIKRGEKPKNEGAKLVKETLDKAEKKTAEIKEKIDERVKELIPKFMHRQSEQIAELNQKIDALTKIVEKLEKKP